MSLALTGGHKPAQTRHNRARRPKETQMQSRSHPPRADLTFPADLVLPPKSQVIQYEDRVTERIVALDTYARELGTGFGIPMTGFYLNDFPVPDSKIDSIPLAVLTVLGTVLTRDIEHISMERRDGRWGLYFTRIANPLVQRQSHSSGGFVPLKDAPLDVRERFLARSEAFFRRYLDQCGDRLASMKGAVDSADRTIAMLASLHLA
ncbi:MAG: hypothetical protein ACKVXR_16870 [Planctomycetota bacterium]